MTSLGSNISALSAVRRLELNQNQLSSTFERLSSGLRINRASDDPAGLAVSSVLGNKARIFNRARLNISDAVSYLSIGDGALGQVSELLVRMAELAEQSANGSLSYSQRKSLNSEYLALDREIRRIVQTTKFNGQEILAGQAQKSINSTDLAISPTTLELVVSPDNRYLAYRTGALNTDITVFDTQSGTTSVIDGTGSLASRPLAITLDGKVVNRRQTGAGSTEIFLYDIESGNNELITDSQSSLDAVVADVSLDGRKLAFASRTTYQDGGSSLSSTGVSASYQVYVIDLESGIIDQVQQDFTTVSELRFSSDGSTLGIEANVGSGVRIYSYNTDSENGQINTLTTANGLGPNSFTIVGADYQGNLIVSSALDLAGNGNGLTNFFQLSPLGAATQLTDFLVSAGIKGTGLSADGTKLKLYLNANSIDASAGSEGQLFELDLISGQYTQITDQSSLDISGTTAYFGRGSENVLFHTSGQVSLADFSRSENQISFEAGLGAAGAINLQLADFYRMVTGVGGYVITSQEIAGRALDHIKESLSGLSRLRGNLGAGLSRLEAASRVTTSLQEQFKAAESRIRDTDVASDVAELTRQRILQDVGVAVLAQAKLQPELSLRLLQVGESTP